MHGQGASLPVDGELLRGNIKGKGGVPAGRI